MLENCEPREVFRFFEKITQIPHGSGNTQMLSDYLVDFAKERNLTCKQDMLGNIIIWKEATPGYEAEPAIMLQGHMDMVAVKELECDIDLKNDPLRVAVDGDYVYAKETSLGGDDGIAVAYALAILDSKKIPHPMLEVVFTVEEEIGMEGADGIDLSLCRARTLINLDSEEEGELIVSCAGGVRVHGSIPVEKVKCGRNQYSFDLEGLTGGHSGSEIDKHRGNAILLFGAFLQDLSTKYKIELCKLEGGTADNAIPADAWAQLVLKETDVTAVEALVQEWNGKLQHDWKETDPGLHLSMTRAKCVAKEAVASESVEKLLQVISQVPNGVMEMCEDMPELVETSLNFGLLNLTEQEITMDFALRSCVLQKKEALVQKVCAVLKKAGVTWELTGDYPAWEYKKESPLREKMEAVYQDLYHKHPKIVSIHAGLECGIIAQKLPGLDCVSCGPDMLDIHTTREKLSISSTKRVWDFLLEVLRKRKNVVLIGMPGAGKSTVGVVLAKNLGFRFVDSDLVIQEKAGKKLHELIAEHGILGFWQYENEVNATLWEDGAVIATGGSAVYGKEAMEHLGRIGTVVYLKLPYEEIEERLGDLTERGVTVKEGQTLKDLFTERTPLYEQYAKITVDCMGKSIRDIVKEIGEAVTKNVHFS